MLILRLHAVIRFMVGRFFGLLVGVIFLMSPPRAYAVDTVDDVKPKTSLVKLDDVFLEPTVRIYEPSQGGVNPLSWYVGAEAQVAPWVKAQVSVGSSNLLYRPSWSSAPTNPLTLLDGLATLHSEWGELYAGQFLIPWGLDGQTLETQLWFPRSLFYEQGEFPLRDEGLGFKTENDGYYLNVVAHNGEGADLPNLDNRLFLTAQWGYLGPAHTNVGVSATAGRLALPNVAYDQHVRGANAFFGFNIFGLGLQIEGSYLENLSQPATIDIFAWHGDIELPITEHVNGIGRYEQLYPNTRVASNNLGRGYLGAEIHSANNISRLFIYLIKNSESQTEVTNDEIRVAWRITPPLE